MWPPTNAQPWAYPTDSVDQGRADPQHRVHEPFASYGATPVAAPHGGPMYYPPFVHSATYPPAQPTFPPNLYPEYANYPPQNTMAGAPYSYYPPQPAPVAPVAPIAPAATVPQKRKPSAKKKAGPKRARKQVDQAGVGPSVPPVHLPTPEMTSSTPTPVTSTPVTHVTTHPDESHAKVGRMTGGADCWALLIGTKHEKDPGGEAKELATNKAHAHLKATPGTLRRPPEAEFPRLLCVPCLISAEKKWHTWSNTDGGSTHGPRKHLSSLHTHKYVVSCHRIGYQLKGATAVFGDEKIQEEITEPGLARYVAELVAEQDLAFNIVRAPSFRRLLCYVGQNNITPDMIPERRMVAQAVSDLSEEAKQQVAEAMQDAEGRISFTSDLWTDEMDRPFMAATAHYKTGPKSNKEGELTVDLIGFRFVDGSHAGENLATVLYGILSEYKILHKIGSVTLDNASNNDTMMEHLQTRLNEDGYVFHKDGNRICCFPHVINLSVGDVIENLPLAADKYLAEQLHDGHVPSPTTAGYLAALQSGLIKRVRETIVALRHGQRRRELKKIGREGNEKGWWKEYEDKLVKETHEDGTEAEVMHRVLVTVEKKLLELILDCKTRWSSTRNMIQRYIYLYPVIDQYISQNKEILGGYTLTLQEFKVLNDIAAVLDIAHEAQELLSAEQTPTLSLTFPVYDQLICRWKEAADKYPALSFAIGAGIQKIEKYINKSRTSPIHILAMFLNPSVKYAYIDKHWTHEERDYARMIVKQYMTKYAVTREEAAQQASSKALLTKASSSLGRGLANMFQTGDKGYVCALEDMGVTPPRRRRAPSTSFSMLPPPDTPTRPSAASTRNGSPSSVTGGHEFLVELEHNRYLALPDSNKFEDLGQIDLVKYWNIQKTLPLLQAISNDVLPVQASSVSSERIFSSSKLTCTRSRNKISVETVERLQILKHSLRHHRRPPAIPDTDADGDDGLVQTLDIMIGLGHGNWEHDAIMDFDKAA